MGPLRVTPFHFFKISSWPSAWKSKSSSVCSSILLSLYLSIVDDVFGAVPPESLQLRESRGATAMTDCNFHSKFSRWNPHTKYLWTAVNFTEFDHEPSGHVNLIGRIKYGDLFDSLSWVMQLSTSTRSHPDVAQIHYPKLFMKYFPNGLTQGSAYWKSDRSYKVCTICKLYVRLDFLVLLPFHHSWLSDTGYLCRQNASSAAQRCQATGSAVCDPHSKAMKRKNCDKSMR